METDEKVYEFFDREESGADVANAHANKEGDGEGNGQVADPNGSNAGEGAGGAGEGAGADPEGNAEERPEGEGSEGSSEEGAVSTFKVGEATYTNEELQEALESHANKSEWTKAQTQRDMKLAEQVEVIGGFSGLAELLQKDKEVAGQIRDILVDQGGEDAGAKLDKLLKFDGKVLSEEHADTHLGRVQKEHEDVQIRAIIAEDRWQFADKHGLTTKEVAKVEAHADRVSKESKGEINLSLESAKRELDNMEKESALKKKEKELKAPDSLRQPDKTGGGQPAGSKKKWNFFD